MHSAVRFFLVGGEGTPPGRDGAPCRPAPIYTQENFIKAECVDQEHLDVYLCRRERTRQSDFVIVIWR